MTADSIIMYGGGAIAFIAGVIYFTFVDLNFKRKEKKKK